MKSKLVDSVDKLDKALQELEEKFNPYHGGDGRFATGSGGAGGGGGPKLAPDTGGGTGGGGEGVAIPSGWQAEKRPYKWKDANTARLRFMDEGRGESWFDTGFMAYGSGPNKLNIGEVVNPYERFSASNYDAKIVALKITHTRLAGDLRKGTFLSINAGNLSRRGESHKKSINVVISSVKQNGQRLEVDYIQVKPSKTKT